MFKYLLLAIVVLLMKPVALLASEGGWSSGGGGFLRDTINPWFLNNISEVKYCITINPENFGLSEQDAEKQINKALEFWRSEFSLAVTPTYRKLGPLQVAQQKFTKTDCGSDTDLVFQLGEFSANQQKDLERPQDYAAAAIRTGYSNKTLRGRGFIYVAPIKGALSLQKHGISSDIWSTENGQFLFLTLVHELGHVFGLQHSGTFGDLMAEGFVEVLLQQRRAMSENDYRYFSLPKVSKAVCPGEQVLTSWQKFFEVAKSFKCFQFEFDHDDRSQLFGTTLLKVLSASSESSKFSIATEVALHVTRFHPISYNLIWLPTGQEVFAKDEILLKNFPSVLGATQLKIIKQGQVTSKSKNLKTLRVEFEQGHHDFSLVGVTSNGELIDLF